MIFAQRLRHGTGKNVNMTEMNGTIHHKIRCYWCNRHGHYSDQCTKTKENKSGNSRKNKNNDSFNEDRKEQTQERKLYSLDYSVNKVRRII